MTSYPNYSPRYPRKKTLAQRVADLERKLVGRSKVQAKPLTKKAISKSSRSQGSYPASVYALTSSGRKPDKATIEMRKHFYELHKL